MNREPKKQSAPAPVKALKWAAVFVATYAAGALLLGGKERLKVGFPSLKVCTVCYCSALWLYLLNMTCFNVCVEPGMRHPL